MTHELGESRKPFIQTTCWRTLISLVDTNPAPNDELTMQYGVRDIILDGHDRFEAIIQLRTDLCRIFLVIFESSPGVYHRSPKRP